MDCIILAGGFGTRLQPLVSNVPKPLAEINGVPFLDLLLKKLQDSGCISNVILAIGYKSEQIVDYYHQHPSITLPIHFSIENSPLGTGGAVKKAFNLVSSQDVLILNGDSYIDFSVPALQKQHCMKNAQVTMAYITVENANRYGQLVIDPMTEQILSFQEKQNIDVPGTISAGVYLFQRDFFMNVKLPTVFSLEKDFFPAILMQHKVYGSPITSIFIDIGTCQSYLDAQILLTPLTKQ